MACIPYGIAAKESSLSAKHHDKVIYLTFDADMTPSMKERTKKGDARQWYSPGVITYLKAHKIPATIFMTGLFAETYPALARDLGAQPYLRIENHTYDHAAFEPRCFGLSEVSSDTEKLREMSHAQTSLIAATGQTPRYVRHPGLCHIRHDDALAREEGLTVSDSGIISGDAFLKDPERIVQNILHQLGKSDVIIMHMGGPHAPATEKALEILVPILEKEGYSLAHY